LIRIALAQINTTVGDLRGNTDRIIRYMKRAVRAGADIVAFPELALTGYPPEDLLLKPQFIRDNLSCLERVIKATGDIVSIVGFVDRNDGIYNAAAVISDHRLIDVYHKIHLPNYGVFDEYRYFKPGNRYPVYDMDGIKFGINICEDIWREDTPAEVQASSGADLIININASPYHMGKTSQRQEIVRSLAKRCGVTIAYLNLIGGQDELVFDGGSFVIDNDGRTLIMANQFKEELLIVDLEVGKKKRQLRKGRKKPGKSTQVTITLIKRDTEKPHIKKKKYTPLSEYEEVYRALELGTRDYVTKNGFEGVVIGMSGGIDSSLVVTVAVDALGKERVHGVFMPSRYSSRESYEDAEALAGNLGISFWIIPIDRIFDSYLKTLAEIFRGLKPDITEENIQARIRGNILMAISNKFRWLVLTTGNKSELSVGYATLYGDMAGGFAVIKDVPKTLVYKLCEWRNGIEERGLIPERVLWKEPSAELKPDQKDTDTLPPYPVLDPVVKAYVEEDKSFEEILKMECDVACVKRVISMVDHSEYKRRQAPPGVKITPRAFGKDRRFPITNRYRSY